MVDSSSVAQFGASVVFVFGAWSTTLTCCLRIFVITRWKLEFTATWTADAHQSTSCKHLHTRVRVHGTILLLVF